MFSLLITVIAITLVAALATATLYFGGPIFNQGAERAQAAKLSAQAQQILGAMALYRAETGAYPNTLADLVSTNYLKSIPVAQAETNVALATAMAATGTWSMATPGQPVIVLAPVDLASCEAFNYSKFGMAGVFKALHIGNLEQCVGTDVTHLMIVTAQSATDLTFASTDPAAVIPIGPVVASPVPAAGSPDTSNDGWLVAPGAPTVTPPGGTAVQVTGNTDLGLITGDQQPTYLYDVYNIGTTTVTLAGITIPGTSFTDLVTAGWPAVGQGQDATILCYHGLNYVASNTLLDILVPTAQAIGLAGGGGGTPQPPMLPFTMDPGAHCQISLTVSIGNNVTPGPITTGFSLQFNETSLNRKISTTATVVPQDQLIQALDSITAHRNDPGTIL